MLIVSDTSPITNLIQIGHLDLLQRVFGQVIIPLKVYEELTVYENQKEEIERRDWILVRKANNQQEVAKLEDILDAGEAEAIVLANELNADVLIIDERKGRSEAEFRGLKIIGLLGVLIQGKRKGYIVELKPILDTLIKDIGFRVSNNLYERILKEVNES